MLWLTTRGTSAFAAAYGGGSPEYLAYLGVPLLIAALGVGVARIADPRARVLLGTGVVFAVFSLGGTLLIDGRQTAVHLPWGVAEHWPIFGSALPDRFALVVGLAAAGSLAGPGAGAGLTRFVRELTGRPPSRAGGVLLWRQEPGRG